ncbi:hypothetical protein [Actinoplanes sp. TFC3]|uniref:hypothetical protein n=1 Tax=Actinoplanes sp. TFC3 TaxID=1710355 RepID=UPI00082AC42A|nr:hypothetical protein [Actinoplanes sp. TFC3]
MSRDPDEGLAGLFGSVEEPAAAEEYQEPVEKPRSKVAWVLRNALLVGAASAITVAVLRSQGLKVSVLLIVAAFVALRLLMLAVSEVAPPPVPRRSGRRGEEPGEYFWSGGDTLRTAVHRWEKQLQWSHDDPDRFSRIVLPALSELTDERLRLRHGITRESDPKRARELMGEPLWEMLNDSVRRTPKPRDLASYVEALERI